MASADELVSGRTVCSFESEKLVEEWLRNVQRHNYAEGSGKPLHLRLIEYLKLSKMTKNKLEKAYIPEACLKWVKGAKNTPEQNFKFTTK